MEAYAAALHQNEPDKVVTVTLYFTTPGEPHRFGWTPAELATLTDELAAEIRARIELLD